MIYSHQEGRVDKNLSQVKQAGAALQSSQAVELHRLHVTGRRLLGVVNMRISVSLSKMQPS